MTTATLSFFKPSNCMKLIPTRYAAGLVAGLCLYAMFVLTPSLSSSTNAKLNSLYAKCATSVLNEQFDQTACSDLYSSYASIGRHVSMNAVNDIALFNLHSAIEANAFNFDIETITNGFMKQLPSGKYVTTRRNSLVDMISTDSSTLVIDETTHQQLITSSLK